MTIRDLPDNERTEAIRSEARRLAASGHFATWQEVEESCLEHAMTHEEVRRIFADAAFREEIESLAEAAHGVGGPATE